MLVCKKQRKGAGSRVQGGAFVLGIIMLGVQISTKLADKQNQTGVCVQYPNSNRTCNNPRVFSHPFTQAWFMFVGELQCLLTFRVSYTVAQSVPSWPPIISGFPLCRCKAMVCDVQSCMAPLVLGREG